MAKEDIELRKYIRLNSVFPVEFSLYIEKGKTISQQYQGFTCNVSEGGICVSARNLKPDDETLLLAKKACLDLEINVPLFAQPAKAKACVAWMRKDKKDSTDKTYLIGLYYHDINPKDKGRIVNYARRLKWMPRLASAAVVILFIGLLTVSFYHAKAKKQNQGLIKQLVAVSEVKSGLEKKLNEFRVRKEMLESKLSAGKGQIELIKDEIAAASIADMDEKAKLHIAVLQEKLKALEQERTAFKDELILTEEGKASLQEQLAQLSARSNEVEKASIDMMLKWIKVHKINKTGLVLSYEGDKELKDWGFTYDEALASILFLIYGDEKSAADILSFYADIAKRSDGLFYNAYDVKSGSVVEYAIHSGPNIWVGIAACQYTHKAKDKRFLALAQQIADKMLKMQKASSDGSIKGGPDLIWVSTEHNLDAYALFAMLYELTKDKRYSDAANISLSWLKDAGYNRPEGRFMRGKGDSTIATDTFSWGIAAIGPGVLSVCGMNPDGIMEFAESECKVQAVFARPDGRKIDIAGFDFAKATNIGRGGVISTEWTAQIVVAFKIMADYYKSLGNIDKERIYRAKAEYYLSQLGQMAISSPSPTGQGEGCLPYASIDNVDTGHGWRVAKGHSTGSLSATIYYIFAYKGFNPLKIK